MFSLFLLPLSQSLKGQVNGKYEYQFYDDSLSAEQELIKKLYTKVRYDGSVKNIQDAGDLDYKVEIKNSNRGTYAIVSQTITNKGSAEKKIDLCTAFVFNEADKFVDAYTIPNFGWSLYYSDTSYNTIVLQNHPWVTSVNAQDFGLEDEPKFFTNNLTILKLTIDSEPGINWLSFSWLNTYIMPGESKTFSYLYYDRNYEPPLLKLDKSLINDEADSKDPIHLKGSFSYYADGYVASAYYAIYDATTGKTVKSGRLGSFTVTTSKLSQDFDLIVEPPSTYGKYTLEVYTYLKYFQSYLSEYFDFEVVAPNYRPKLYIVPLEYTYYIPNTEVTFSASIYDEDLGDKPLTAKIFFNNKEVTSQEVANNRDLKTLKFKVPEGTRAGEYEVKVTATDGKKIGTKKFNIVIKDNTILTIDFEPALNSTYKKGEKVSFTAVINDPDTNFDNKFTVSLYYNDALKTSLSSENKNGLVRIPLSFNIPDNEINTTAEIKIKVQTPTESNDRTASINIHQEFIGENAESKIAARETKKKNALIAVLCVLAVLAVIVLIVVIILWIRVRN